MPVVVFHKVQGSRVEILLLAKCSETAEFDLHSHRYMAIYEF